MNRKVKTDFEYLRTAYVGEELASLEDEYLETLQEVIVWGVDDAGKELGFEIIADLLVDLDVEVVKMWLEFIQILFEKSPNNPNVIVNSICYLLLAKEKFGDNITPDEFEQFIFDEIVPGRPEETWASYPWYDGH